MTNINCTKNCIYQKNGQCDYSEVYPSYPAIQNNCAYFINSLDSNTTDSGNISNITKNNY